MVFFDCFVCSICVYLDLLLLCVGFLGYCVSYVLMFPCLLRDCGCLLFCVALVDLVVMDWL